MDIVAIITLVHTLSKAEPDFEKFKQKVEIRLEQWEKDTDSNDRGRFLNDKFLELEVPTDEKSLRTVIFWVALYDAWDEPPSKALTEMLEKYKDFVKDIKFADMNFKGIENKVLAGITGHGTIVQEEIVVTTVSVPIKVIEASAKIEPISTKQTLNEYIQSTSPMDERDDIILDKAEDKERPTVALK